MSTPTPQSGPTPAPAAPAPAPARQREIVVISHSGLFYWWPVWAVGFVMFLITWLTGEVMLTAPPPVTAVHKGYTDKEGKQHDIYVLPLGHALPDDPDHPDSPRQPKGLWVSSNKNVGVFFCAVLLLVIVITNIPLRGLWSVITVVVLVSLVIIFGLLGWWEKILHHLSFLDIRINMAGYLVISAILFALWLIVTFLFDQQIYMIFTSGQMRVRIEIGDAETAFDTTGMTIQKQRSDLFRHWILGLGSGDLIVRTGGSNPQEFHMNNVLFVGRKVQEIEEMLRERQVVTSRT
jgi:hypothetical protein